MMKNKNAQVGIEYMVVIGFVTLAIITTLAMAVFYSGQAKDRIKLNQVESFAVQLINSAESVFFAGEPSKTTVSLYLPDGVSSITFSSNDFIVTTTTSSGDNVRVYTSKVPLNGTIPVTEGIKKLTIEAKETLVQIG